MRVNQLRYALIVKKACPTCLLIEPVIQALSAAYANGLTVYSQDDPSFPPAIETPVDDSALAFSYAHKIDIVPTLLCLSDANVEIGRVHGWDRAEWQQFTGIANLGEQLPGFKPGCGSRTQDPGMEEILALKYGPHLLHARQVELADAEDIMEACFDRGWTDGLPVVPPTALRVMRMLRATHLDPAEIVGRIPPDNVPCSVEKVAINAVLAGCKPEYFPVVLASVAGALQDRFCMHGLLCTTYFSSPVLIVNGPVTRQIGMNAGVNALGQGNRANATIGRALQLLVRNVGGGLPGGIDRATLGNPGKYTYCFAEDESDSDWPSLAMDRDYARDESVVSLFAGDGLHGVVDQQSRNPESLAKSIAMSLRTVANYKLCGMADAILVISPEHRRVFRQAGWTKANVRDALYSELMIPGADIVRGAHGIAEGMPEKFRDKILSKFRDDGLHIVSAGGKAGLFSAIIGGWVASGERGSQLVSQKIAEQNSG